MSKRTEKQASIISMAKDAAIDVITFTASEGGVDFGDLIFIEEFQDKLIGNKAFAGPEGRRAEYICPEKLEAGQTGNAYRIAKLISTDTSDGKKQQPVYLSADIPGKCMLEKQEEITEAGQIQKVGTITKAHKTKGQILFTLPGSELIKKQPPEPKEETPEPEKEEKPAYSFPTQSRCPRCRTLDTAAYHTKGRVQYRKCLRAICRHRYSVIGTKA